MTTVGNNITNCEINRNFEGKSVQVTNSMVFIIETNFVKDKKRKQIRIREFVVNSIRIRFDIKKNKFADLYAQPYKKITGRWFDSLFSDWSGVLVFSSKEQNYQSAGRSFGFESIKK